MVQKVLKIDNDYHKVQQIIKRDGLKKEEGKSQWSFQKEKDENAMDVNVITKVYKTMTDEERAELMKKGLCFRCPERGDTSAEIVPRRWERPQLHN